MADLPYYYKKDVSILPRTIEALGKTYLGWKKQKEAKEEKRRAETLELEKEERGFTREKEMAIFRDNLLQSRENADPEFVKGLQGIMQTPNKITGLPKTTREILEEGNELIANPSLTRITRNQDFLQKATTPFLSMDKRTEDELRKTASPEIQQAVVDIEKEIARTKNLEEKLNLVSKIQQIPWTKKTDGKWINTVVDNLHTNIGKVVQLRERISKQAEQSASKERWEEAQYYLQYGRPSKKYKNTPFNVYAKVILGISPFDFFIMQSPMWKEFLGKTPKPKVEKKFLTKDQWEVVVRAIMTERNISKKEAEKELLNEGYMR